MSEIAESFASSLSELTINSKPHINMLTMLAEDSLDYAAIITETVVTHLQKVRSEVKLPVLYLIDSIVKNVGQAYITHFTNQIVNCFAITFKEVDEKTREQLFKLRQTWDTLFPPKTLFALDTRIKTLDPAWPCAPPPSTVHLNPKFFKTEILDSKSVIKTKDRHSEKSRLRKNKSQSSSRSKKSATSSVKMATEPVAVISKLSQENLQVIKKQKLLLELQQQKLDLELELMQTKAQLEEQQKALEKSAASTGSGNPKSAELMKLKQQLNQEEANLNVMRANLKVKKSVQMKFPKMQQAHQMTTELRAAQKAALVPGGLMKPGALLELNSDDLSVKPALPLSTAKPPKVTLKDSKPSARLPSLLTPSERPKPSAPTEPSVQDGSAPVRIAPVSSDLINAAIIGRKNRDPRIRQMSSRLESQLVSAGVQPLPPPTVVPVSSTTAYGTHKKPEPAQDPRISSNSKFRRERRPTANERSKSSERTFDSAEERFSKPLMSQEKPKSSKPEERSKTDKSAKSGRTKSGEKHSPRKSEEKLKPTEPFCAEEKSKDLESMSEDKYIKSDNTSRILSGSNPEENPSDERHLKSEERSKSSDRSRSKSSDRSRSKSSERSISEDADSRSRSKSKEIKSDKSQKKSESDKRHKSDSLFSTRSKSPRSPSKLHSKRDQTSSEALYEQMSQVVSEKPSQVPASPLKAYFKRDQITSETQNERFSQGTDEKSSQLSSQAEVKSSNVELENNMSIENYTDSIVPMVSAYQANESRLPVYEQSYVNQVRIVNDHDFIARYQEDDLADDKSVKGEEPLKNLFDYDDCVEEEVVMTDMTDVPDFEEYVPYGIKEDSIQGMPVLNKMSEFPDLDIREPSSTSEIKEAADIKEGHLDLGEPDDSVPVVPEASVPSPKEDPKFETIAVPEFAEKLPSPKRPLSPDTTVERMEVIPEVVEDFPHVLESPKKKNSPMHLEKRRKPDKPSIMEQIIADAETHDSSPSPPLPPVISDKFKEIKKDSLSRLRRVGRSRESESPEPADIDLRHIPAPPLKNEVLGLAEKDVDLRSLPASPSKKRPSMEKLLDTPPVKKSKAEVMDDGLCHEPQNPVYKIRYIPTRNDSNHWYNNTGIYVYQRLFGSEDVDLRTVLCPPIPSPPPPPIISSSPPPERGWARYKEKRPDEYRAKYTPTRRDRTQSVSIDRLGRSSKPSVSEGNGWQDRRYSGDVDMRGPPGGGEVSDTRYNQILMRATEQHKSGELNAQEFQRVLSEVFTMREKRQLEEAQRRDEEESAHNETLEPISEDEISTGSFDDLENVPSPTDSYSGGEEEKKEEKEEKENKSDGEKSPDKNGEVGRPEDARINFPSNDMDERRTRKTRETSSPYTRRSKAEKDSERDRRHADRDEQRAQRRENREKRSRRTDEKRERGRRKEEDRDRMRIPEEERELRRYRRYSAEGQKSPVPVAAVEPITMEVDGPPRVPPLTPHFQAPLEPPPGLPTVPPVLPTPHPPWEQHLPIRPWGPSGPPHMLRGPQGLGPRPQDRFMPSRSWRQPQPPGPYDPEMVPPRFNRFAPPPSRFSNVLLPGEIPPTDLNVLKLIEEDPTRSINIDGMSRDIRFYGLTAVAMMTWDDPREVTFQPGQRRVIVDDRDSALLHFNAPPVEMLIDGQPHRVRFGAPTRELYIDNQWHEVFFGGAPVVVEVGGVPRRVQLEGPPPHIRPGAARRDLVMGRITLIIDAKHFFPIFLDAKPQKFEMNGIAYIIRFVEALQKTVINGIAFNSDFGGLPRPIILNSTKHFFKLTSLPRGVTPGYLTIVNMEGGRLPSPPPTTAPLQAPPVPPLLPPMDGESAFLKPPQALPNIVSSPAVMPTVDTSLPPPPTPPSSVPVRIVPPPMPPSLAPIVNPLDMLTMMPVVEPSRSANTDYSYSVVDAEEGSQPSTSSSAPVTSVAPSTTAPAVTGEINVAELLQKLMATGIMTTLEPEKAKDKEKEKPTLPETPLIRPVDFKKPETLKTRQTVLVAHLYSGIQCNSCGVRFPPEQTMRYSQHLDWHFRQNRRDKDSTRSAQTRRYYYDVSDWVQFEEIEDLEERAQPWFEMQEGAEEEEEVPAPMVSVRAADYPEDASCHVCHDKFESFYNEEKEEWQLRNAEDKEGNLVHPVCWADQQAALAKPIVVDDIDITEDEVPTVEKKEEEKDDDIMEVMDLEVVKPVFPVEDLTVSDSESVADKDEKPTDPMEDEKVDEEEKTEEVAEDKEMTTEEGDLPKEDEEKGKEQSEGAEKEDEGATKEGEETEVDNEKEPEVAKDEDTQDEVISVEKGEDSNSILSTAEIMEVVKHIKKDPDALGGEFEDTEMKTDRGEVMLPAPVVHTTLTSVNCLIDGNVEFDETPQQTKASGPARIKINITKPVVQVSKEKEEEVVEDTPNSMLPATLALVSQPPPPGEEPVPQSLKPRLLGKKLQEMPPVLKGSELSGLCSIM